MYENLDHVVLTFNKESLLLLNACIALIMFGVALDLKVHHFKYLLKTPKVIFIGLASQLLLLPLITFLLVLLLKPSPSMALGMMLVAACPGGNVSNFYASLSNGNVALSVSLTAITSSLAFLSTPLNFTFWANQYAPTAAILHSVKLDILDVIITVVFILVIPLVLGMLVNKKHPKTTLKIAKPIKRLSILIFAGFVVGALASNFDHFVNYIFNFIFLVMIHNALALTTGYSFSKLFKIGIPETRSITIETGIQNSGLALVIIFEYFNGMGGMAIIAAWWGVWHLISGALISWQWSSRPAIAATP
ncbi:bile acid:sodium symporter family protein [Reichenbachiella carrageenanivorans]|uniref:Bile acid:sodium symporter family protein n=1 Tax=Reichenbachiella carrageenanivorans TaxID=2979869 RepID=A0ABY6D2X3_9BACT|nr:bile acid:sodium symporter family protein [Reichenbachiella carrageenanivorans]UXX80244.1 bile acid:sodium symporter family protein [Reichenbachiella carrageenanivorans]